MRTQPMASALLPTSTHGYLTNPSTVTPSLVALMLAMILLLSFAMEARAQTVWTQKSPGFAPPARSYTSMAYDAVRGRAVLFGGVAWNGARLDYDDTWEWDGTNWAQQNPAFSPSPRAGHRLVYHEARARVVLFGGFTGGTTSSAWSHETWEWDGSSWTRLNTTNDPIGRLDHGMVYEAGRDRVLVFGGNNYFLGDMSDTWALSGSNWTQLSPISSPGGRSQHAMAYDASRGRVVVFGGIGRPGGIAGVFGDTWEWDGGDWIQRHPSSNPLPRILHGLAYDAARQRTVLFSGTVVTARPADTWEWNGIDWTQGSPAAFPPGRDAYALTYDSARRQTVLFGGGYWAANSLDDTWEYGPSNPASYTPFGTGCPGGSGRPDLAPVPWSLPWLGDTFVVRLTNLGTNPADLPIGFLGDSRTFSAGTPLPRDLTAWGMPRCWQYINPVATYLLTNNAGVANWSIAVPNTAALLSAAVYMQAAAVSPGVNALGVVTSNAGELRIGAR